MPHEPPITHDEEGRAIEDDGFVSAETEKGPQRFQRRDSREAVPVNIRAAWWREFSKLVADLCVRLRTAHEITGFAHPPLMSCRDGRTQVDLNDLGQPHDGVAAQIKNVALANLKGTLATAKVLATDHYGVDQEDFLQFCWDQGWDMLHGVPAEGRMEGGGV